MFGGGGVISGSVPDGRVPTVASTRRRISDDGGCVTRLYLPDAEIRSGGFALFQRFTGSSARDPPDPLDTDKAVVSVGRANPRVHTYTSAAQGPVLRSSSTRRLGVNIREREHAKS